MMDHELRAVGLPAGRRRRWLAGRRSEPIRRPFPHVGDPHARVAGKRQANGGARFNSTPHWWTTRGV